MLVAGVNTGTAKVQAKLVDKAWKVSVCVGGYVCVGGGMCVCGGYVCVGGGMCVCVCVCQFVYVCVALLCCFFKIIYIGAETCNELFVDLR